MTRFLLDANVLIALTHPEHVHHVRARRWFADTTEFALCPVTEGALLRFMLRIGESSATGAATLKILRSHPRADFWPDALSYAEIDMNGVVGHRQVTDAYLAALAQSNGGLLATFDEGIAVLRPQATLLVPDQ